MTKIFLVPKELIEMQLKQIEDAVTFALGANLWYDLPCRIMYSLNNITNTGLTAGTCDFYHYHNTHHTDWSTFKKILSTAFTEQEHYIHSSGNRTHANFATDDDSIFTFCTIVANLEAKYAQDNVVMSHLQVWPNPTIKSNNSNNQVPNKLLRNTNAI